MKKYLKRYWHDIPFLGLAIRAVMLTTAIAGLITLTYFLVIVVPIEIKHFKNEKAQRELKIRQKIAEMKKKGTNDGGYIWVV